MWAGLGVTLVMLGTLAAGVSHAQQQAARADGRAWQAAGQRRPGPGPARPRGGMMGPGMMGGHGLPLRQLGLSEEQRQKVREILGAHQAEFRALAERMAPTRRALADAITAGDEGAIRQHGADLGAAQTDRALLAAKVRNEVFKVLTPEQQQKAESLRQQFQQRREQRRPGRQGGFPTPD